MWFILFKTIFCLRMPTGFTIGQSVSQFKGHFSFDFYGRSVQCKRGEDLQTKIAISFNFNLHAPPTSADFVEAQRRTETVFSNLCKRLTIQDCLLEERSSEQRPGRLIELFRRLYFLFTLSCHSCFSRPYSQSFSFVAPINSVDVKHLQSSKKTINMFCK